MLQKRTWCFTLNNYTEDDCKNILEWTDTKYIIFGKEIAPETGTPHLQGYVVFNSGIRLTTLKNKHAKMHWEAAKGNAAQNYKYCSKGGLFTEKGEIPRPGTRTDIAEAITLLREHGIIQVAREMPEMIVRYGRGLERLTYLSHEDRREQPMVIWLWGETGSGKTKEATECKSFYMKDETCWWDGYTGQQRIIIDDFDGKWPYRDFLRLLDRYPYQGQIKGGFVKINSPEIYITSEFPPEHYWPRENELKQVLRRIRYVTKVSVTKVEGNTALNLGKKNN